MVSDEAGRRRGKAEALERSSSPWSMRRARTERINGLGWIKGKQRLALVGWIGSGEKKLVGGRIPRGIWWNGGGGWEDGTSLLKFRVGLYI